MQSEPSKYGTQNNRILHKQKENQSSLGELLACEGSWEEKLDES